MIQRLKHTMYEEMLTEMSFLSLKRNLGGSLVAVSNFLKEGGRRRNQTLLRGTQQKHKRQKTQVAARRDIFLKVYTEGSKTGPEA